jgi:hypothetical protein
VWFKIFDSIWHKIKEPKNECFRWLILLHKLPYKFNYVDVDICTICKTLKTIRHILFDCMYSNEKWKLFCNDLKIWDKNDKVEYKHVLFNTKKLRKDFQFFNLVSTLLQP